MNIDTGAVKLWSELTPEEQASGRWIRFDGNLARLKTELDAIFAKALPKVGELEADIASLEAKIRAASGEREGGA